MLVIDLLVVALSALAAVLATLLYLTVRRAKGGKKALRYAVTLVQNEGAFIGLCIERRRDYWTFVDVKVTPVNPSQPYVEAAPGALYVPTRNILYYQEIQEVANAA